MFSQMMVAPVGNALLANGKSMFRKTFIYLNQFKFILSQTLRRHVMPRSSATVGCAGATFDFNDLDKNK